MWRIGQNEYIAIQRGITSNIPVVEGSATMNPSYDETKASEYSVCLATYTSCTSVGDALRKLAGCLDAVDKSHAAPLEDIEV